MMAKLVELIYTFERVGKGTEADPIRLIPQLWSKDGQLIAQQDPEQKHDQLLLLNLNA